MLARDGRASLFFNNCSVPGNPPMEDIGDAFGQFLARLRYSDGTAVAEVDVVAHSIGGLIVRSYISGKTRERGVFRPPAETRIRKAVFLAVPFFGAVAATIAGAPTDVQTQQSTPGSQFLFDLATWNQGMDDLRGIDAIAVAGNAGTGVLSGIARFDESTVAVTSASLDWIFPGRTRVVPYCHTTLTGLLALACSTSNGIAQWTADNHEAARIAISFLNGTSEWRSIGEDLQSAGNRGGLQLQFRDAEDRVLPLQAATGGLSIRNNEIVWSDRLTAGRTEFIISAGGTMIPVTATVPQGATAAAVAKSGPSVFAVYPNLVTVLPRAVAPGMLISIYGSQLSNGMLAAEGLPYPTSLAGTEVRFNGVPGRLTYVSPAQVNAIAPEDASGLMQLTVRTGAGSRTVNVLVEPALPAVFPVAINAATGGLITAEAPVRRGEFLSLFLTGLGVTERRADGLDWARQQPQVNVGGQPCMLQYAGRAPGYDGLDQINCQIASAASVGSSAPVTVTVGRRTGATSINLQQ